MTGFKCPCSTLLWQWVQFSTPVATQMSKCYHDRSHFSSSCRPQNGLSYLKACLCSFLFNSLISCHCFMDLIKAISSSYRLPCCHSGLITFQPSSMHSLFKPVGLWKVWMDGPSQGPQLSCATFCILPASSGSPSSDQSPCTAPALDMCCIKLDAGLHMESHENGVDGENPPPPPVATFLLMQPRIRLGF